LDLLRGVIMVLMSLDHSRDFFTNFPFAPEDFPHTWPALFFTRWITHFCAPLFFFLAGAGANLSATRGRSPADVRRFLWTRGLWLVALELTVVGFGWTFILWANAGVLWALGWSMVLMSVVVRMPPRWVAAFGLVMIFTHNLFDRVQVEGASALGWLWMIVHQPGLIPVLPEADVFHVFYALVPSVGVMAAGYGFGEIIRMDAPRRRRFMLAIGGAATLLFVALRAGNLYGQPSDPRVAFASLPRFEVQPTFIMTVVAFLDVQKYPFALQYLLMTLGPGILMLWLFDAFETARYSLARALVLFGRVPLFYYLLHIYLIHLAACVVAYAAGQPWEWLFHGGFMVQRPPQGYGHGLVFVYAAWIAVNVVLYFPCRWFAEYKRRNNSPWLSYI
jgi:uncharacterized membrane protein